MPRIFFFLLFCFTALGGTAAFSQATVSLSERTEMQLLDGGRARVIVEFTLPDFPAHDGNSSSPDDIRIEAISDRRDVIFQRVLDLSTGEGSIETNAGSDRIVRLYVYSPLAALNLTRDEIEALENDPEVVSITSDSLDRPTLSRTVPQIGAAALHEVGAGGQGETIAILDTGIHYNHPAFAGRIRGSACFSSNNAADNASSTCIGVLKVTCRMAQLWPVLEPRTHGMRSRHSCRKYCWWSSD